MSPGVLLPEHHKWVADTFGIDPRAYQAPARNGADPGSLAARLGALRKMSRLWAAEEAKINSAIASLRAEIASVYDGDDAASQVDSAFQGHVDSVMKNFDGSLAELLAAGSRCRTADEMAKVEQAVRARIRAYMDFVANDPVIETFDGNPMVRLNIAQSCLGTLGDMLATLAAA